MAVMSLQFGISSRMFRGHAIARSIPDTVTSRPTDDNPASVTRGLGLTISPNADFEEIGFRISNNTSNATRARVYDHSQSAYVLSKDISSLSSGDTETFVYDFISGQDYGFELDNNGSSWTVGFLFGTSRSYPYTGEDIDIVARSDEGSQTTSGASSINDIGYTGF